MTSKSNVLFIGTNTFGISKKIQKELIEQYGSCHFMDERLGLRGIALAPFKIFPFLRILLSPFYIFQTLKIRCRYFDKVLVLRGEFFPLWYAKWLNGYCNNVVYYTWDSFSNYPRMRYVANCFSRAYTFDYSDSKSGLGYKALFMSGQILETREKDIDIFYFGTYHSDRLLIADKLLTKHKNLKIYVFLYHQYPLLQLLLDSIKHRRWLFKYRHLISSESLSNDTLNELIRRSHCLLDVHHQEQTGLTLRTFDAIRGKCKLITTNKYTLEEAAFDNTNSFILKRDLSPFPELDWIRSLPVPLKSDVLEYYSLASWVKFLLK